MSTMFMNKLRSHSIRFINKKNLNNVKIFINKLHFLDQKYKLYRQNFFKALFRSNENEAINFKPLYFFYENISQAQKTQNAHERTKIKKAAFFCTRQF